MRSTRLLMTADAVGGVWQYATDLAATLGPLGYETVLAVLGPQPSPAQCEEAGRIPGLTLHHLSIEMDWLAQDAKAIHAGRMALGRLAEDLNADLVQINSPAFIGPKTFRVPVVGVMHSCVATWWTAVKEGPMPADFHWRTRLTAEGLGQASAVVAPSESFASEVQKQYVLKHRPHVVHNGRRVPAQRPAAMHDCAITVGRLWDEAKNVRVLDAAAAKLAIPFTAIGATTGPHGETVHLSHMHVAGQRNNETVANCLAARPVFVSAARYEPFGLAVLEAAEAGCALVLSDIPTFRELWDGVANFVQPDDAAGFAFAIDAIAGDIPLRHAAGERARRRAKAFSADAMARGMDALYRSLLRTKVAA